MKNNKKGFTLIELLAVIVVLAIIMVIATGQVSKSITSARNNSWESACKVLIKEGKRLNAEHQLDSKLPDASCADTASCISKYDVSSEDYDNFTVTESSGTYTLSVSPKGKFAGASYTCTNKTF